MRQPYPPLCWCQGPFPPGADRRRGTEVVEDALGTSWRPCQTDSSPVQDQAEAKTGPLLGWDQPRDVGLDPDRIVAFGQAQTVRQADDMRIDRKTRNIERHAQDHVRRLASDAGKRHQVLDSRRHLAMKSLRQRGAAGDDGLRFDVEESGRLDDAFDVQGVRWASPRGSPFLPNYPGVTEFTGRT